MLFRAFFCINTAPRHEDFSELCPQMLCGMEQQDILSRILATMPATNTTMHRYDVMKCVNRLWRSESQRWKQEFLARAKMCLDVELKAMFRVGDFGGLLEAMRNYQFSNVIAKKGLQYLVSVFKEKRIRVDDLVSTHTIQVIHDYFGANEHAWQHGDTTYLPVYILWLLCRKSCQNICNVADMKQRGVFPRLVGILAVTTCQRVFKVILDIINKVCFVLKRCKLDMLESKCIEKISAQLKNGELNDLNKEQAFRCIEMLSGLDNHPRDVTQTGAIQALFKSLDTNNFDLQVQICRTLSFLRKNKNNRLKIACRSRYDLKQLRSIIHAPTTDTQVRRQCQTIYRGAFDRRARKSKK